MRADTSREEERWRMVVMNNDERHVNDAREFMVPMPPRRLAGFIWNFIF